jgi:ribosomal protein S24E
MMKLDIIEEKKNPFLKRDDLILMIDHTGQATPSMNDVKKAIAEKFKSTPEKVEVLYIFTQTGAAKSRVKCRIWEEGIPEKKAKKLEEKPKEKPEAEEKKPEEKKEEPKEKPSEKKEEAKPKEEVKEELKKEQKPPEKK